MLNSPVPMFRFTYPQLTSTSSGSSEESTDHEHIISKRSAPESEDDPHNDDLLSGLSLQSEYPQYYNWIKLNLAEHSRRLRRKVKDYIKINEAKACLIMTCLQYSHV